MDYAELPNNDPSSQEHLVNITSFSLRKNQKSKERLRQQAEFQAYALHQYGGDIMHEINVPTASYRMGVAEMALGLAVIDMNQSETVFYVNLWLPSR